MKVRWTTVPTPLLGQLDYMLLWFKLHDTLQHFPPVNGLLAREFSSRLREIEGTNRWVLQSLRRAAPVPVYTVGFEGISVHLQPGYSSLIMNPMPGRTGRIPRILMTGYYNGPGENSFWQVDYPFMNTFTSAGWQPFAVRRGQEMPIVETKLKDENGYAEPSDVLRTLYANLGWRAE